MRVLEWLINWILWFRIHILSIVGHNFDRKPKNLNRTSELTFLDDFNKGVLDTEQWRTDNYYGFPIHPGNIVDHNTAPDIIYTPDNHIMSGGQIHMFTKKETKQYHFVDWDGKDWGKWDIPYTSGQIQHAKFEQQYGYFEAAITVPTTPGTWPAFWLCSRHSWPPEIDIFEFYTGKGIHHFESNVHYDFTPHKKMRVSPGYNFVDANDMNVWAVDWQKDYMKFYFNNILIRVIYDKKILDYFKFPMFVIINNSIDTGKGRRLSEMESPNFMAVDWVRVWQNR